MKKRFSDVSDEDFKKVAEIIDLDSYINSFDQAIGKSVKYNFILKLRRDFNRIEDIVFFETLFGCKSTTQELPSGTFYWITIKGSRAIEILERSAPQIKDKVNLVNAVLDLRACIKSDNRGRLSENDKKTRVDLFKKVRAIAANSNPKRGEGV